MRHRSASTISRARAACLASVFAVLLGTGSAAPVAAQSIHKCETMAEGNMQRAADYISKRLEPLVRTFTVVTADDRDKFTRHWPRIKLFCEDDGTHGKSRVCLAKSRTGGLAHGGLGNRVNVCYFNLVDLQKNTCDLVGVIAHEFAHANGFPQNANHDNLSEANPQGDVVYAVGRLAREFCMKEIGNPPLLTGRSKLALNEACDADDQCLSGRCIGHECQCDQDADCDKSRQERCFKPAIGANFCSTTNRAIDAACDRNDQCLSNRCQGDQCVCAKDSDCKNPRQPFCRKPLIGTNHCDR